MARLAPVAPAVVLALAVVSCRGGARGRDAGGPVDPAAEASKLSTFLPATLGPFAAARPASTSFDAPSPGAPPRIVATRAYASPDGRGASVTLATGDTNMERGIVDSDAEHAFGSDTPTYWRTVTVAGRRTRVAEERPKPVRSECYVQVGPNHVATVDVTPASVAGECATVASLLDLARIEASGGVAGPPRRLTR